MVAAAVGRVVVGSTTKVVVRKGAAVVPLARDTALLKYIIRRFTAKGLAKRAGKGIVKEVLLRPTIEAVAVSIFDQRSIKSAAQFVTLSGEGEKAVERGGPFPTTDEATEAWVEAVEGVQRDDVVLLKRSKDFIRDIAAGGFTPIIPIVGRAVRRNVLIGLGVPRWVVFVSSLVVPV